MSFFDMWIPYEFNNSIQPDRVRRSHICKKYLSKHMWILSFQQFYLLNGVIAIKQVNRKLLVWLNEHCNIWKVLYRYRTIHYDWKWVITGKMRKCLLKFVKSVWLNARKIHSIAWLFCNKYKTLFSIVNSCNLTFFCTFCK